MIAHLLVAALLTFAASASAQTIYRCEVAGSVTYTSRPCAQGIAKRIELGTKPPAELVKMAAARLQVAVADFNARHPVDVSGEGKLAFGNPPAQGRSHTADNRRFDDSAWCITRNDDGEVVTNDRRNVNLLVSIPRRR